MKTKKSSLRIITDEDIDREMVAVRDYSKPCMPRRYDDLGTIRCRQHEQFISKCNHEKQSQAKRP